MAKRMQRLYRAKNGVVDGSDFWISDSAQPRRGKAKASDARKQEANRNQAAHILGRKLNNNFEQGDLFLTLTWDDTNWRKLRSAAYKTLAKGSREKAEVKRDAMLFEAEKEGKLFIRRVREAGAKNCKYMILASDMDGDTKDPARVHVHIIISGESVTQEQKQLRICGRTLEGFWPFGDADYEYLRDGSYSRLAAYLIKQTRDIKHHKKYACSRNLEPIEYEDIEVEPGSEPLHAPAGAKVEEYQHDPTNPYGMVYIRYIEPRDKAPESLPKPREQDKKPKHKRGGST